MLTLYHVQQPGKYFSRCAAAKIPSTPSSCDLLNTRYRLWVRPQRHVRGLLGLTLVRHHFAGLEVHLGAAGRADLVDVVAELVAAVLPAAEAQAFVEGLLGVAAEGHALLVGVEQGVDEEVDGALVGALDQLVHI